MKKDEITIGGTYLAKVSDRVVPVRIDAENRHGGWDATNLRTGKKVRIKSAQRLRCRANPDGSIDERTGYAPRSQLDLEETMKLQAVRARKATNGQAKLANKLSCLDAAAKVLGENDQAMNCQEMIEAMAAKKYWTSPGGKTPAATLYSAILREITTKGRESRFTKSERGKFVLAR